MKQHPLKQPAASPTETPVTAETQEPVEISSAVDSLVDDLSQQDVMPAGSSETMLDGDLALMGNALGGSPIMWDEPQMEPGERVPRVPLEDEIKASELLVQDGLYEADEDLRELDENAERDEEGGEDPS